MPSFAWELVKEGGPWAILLLVCGGFLLARARGMLATDKDIERTVGGYREVISHQEKELTFWRGAHEKQTAVIDKQAEQIAKLMVNADLSTYAIQSVIREAKRRELDS